MIVTCMYVPGLKHLWNVRIPELLKTELLNTSSFEKPASAVCVAARPTANECRILRFIR